MACLFRQTMLPARSGCFRRCTAQKQSLVTHRFVDSQLGPIVQEARHAPAVVLPGPPVVKQRTSVQPPGNDTPTAVIYDDHVIYPFASKATDSHVTSNGRNTAPVQQQSAPLPNKKVRPSRMDFEAAYQQLCEWKQLYLSAHVPRYCFDAPELGAWVRKMRKQHTEQELEQWKVERLNQLSFEWELTDQDAKWHHLYHQLRRYQLLHGTTDIDISHSEQDGCDWSQVSWWLKKQARLLAKQKLSGHKRDMLAQLGVTLRIPKRIVTRTAQLQALNGPERRKLRKKWKKLDQAAADEAREQREQVLQKQQVQQQLQQEVANRRLALLREAAGPAADAGLYGSSLETHDRSNSSSTSSSSGMDQQLQQQYCAQLGLVQQQVGQQEQQEQKHTFAAATASASTDSSSGKGSRGSKRHAPRHSITAAMHSSSSSSPMSRPPDDAYDRAAAAVQQQQQQPQQSSGVDPADEASAHSQQATVAGKQQQQLQQPGLLYQRNRRHKRVASSTKQERWLSANRHS